MNARQIIETAQPASEHTAEPTGRGAESATPERPFYWTRGTLQLFICKLGGTLFVPACSAFHYSSSDNPGTDSEMARASKVVQRLNDEFASGRTDVGEREIKLAVRRALDEPEVRVSESVEYKPRFIPAGTENELIDLWHLARTALAGKQDASGKHLGSDRHARMVWAAGEFAKKHGISATAAYKDLDGLLS